jgi:hypothetical protein
MKCILIQTKDNRKFFTSVKNYNQLVEFAKVFDALLLKVQTEKIDLMSLDDLAKAFCDSQINMNNISYTISKTSKITTKLRRPKQKNNIRRRK